MCNGILHNFSSTFSPALINCLDNLSLFEKRPAYSEPRDTIIAPVNVAKSTINCGLNFLSVNVRASAKTSLPYASVFKISIVLPLYDLTMSPGLCALPLTIFSTRPTTPTALIFAFLKAKFFISPTTVAEPAMS